LRTRHGMAGNMPDTPEKRKSPSPETADVGGETCEYQGREYLPGECECMPNAAGEMKVHICEDGHWVETEEDC